jgi:hypothetical protein
MVEEKRNNKVGLGYNQVVMDLKTFNTTKCFLEEMKRKKRKV